ncbi:winged helix-turn-helix transcriptional regulator [Cohnella caldifontis]|uniref:winged helix-turn-helix transcriptional regulator n=1 Tax=Cohnella caldifontis TaxID=3027471 RepID=UPI0023EDE744|nr:helix-turn-helix domain-containing protein [Cohnella sp. YIM B05605]
MQSVANELCNSVIEDVLNVVGSKWAFLVIGHLYYGPCRFNQMKKTIPAISTQSLSSVLRQLEENGVVTRRAFATVPVTVEYSLSDKGRDFVQVIDAMRQCGYKWRHQSGTE